MPNIKKRESKRYNERIISCIYFTCSVIPFTISGTITLMYKYRVTIFSFVPMSGNIRFL